MSNELELKVQLNKLQIKEVYKLLHSFKFYIPKKYQKDIVYTLQDTPNKQNLLRIRKEKYFTFLTYKRLCFKNNTFIGCYEFENKGLFNIDIEDIFSQVNYTYGLRADTSFKLKIKDLEKYISRVYAPFIVSKNIIEKIRQEVTIFNLNGKKLNLALDNVNGLGYFLEIEYLSDEKLTDDKKLEIRTLLENYLKYLLGIDELTIIKKGYLSMLKE